MSEEKKIKRVSRNDNLTENYQYSPGKNEKLIVDRPSVPLNKNELKEQKVTIKSNKELYESFIKELKNFSLSVNGEVLYNSSIDKSGNLPVKFENDYFVLFGKKYSYNGLKIQKIN